MGAAGRRRRRNVDALLRESYEEHSGQFSPDGRWVAYVSDESGRREIYIRPFPGPGAASPVSTAGGIAPRWEKTGKELYYIAPDSTLMAAPIAVKGDSLAVGVPLALFQTQIFGEAEPSPRLLNMPSPLTGDS